MKLIDCGGEYDGELAINMYGIYIESIYRNVQSDIIEPEDLEVVGNIYENPELLEGR